MKERDLLHEIGIFIGIVAVGLIFLTFFAHLIGHDFLGFTGLWYELDVRIEGSLATWGESMLMLLCAIPAYVLFRRRDDRIPMHLKIFFLVIAFAAIYFSADEMIGIHELIGKKTSELTGLGDGTVVEGFSWVLVYAPLALIGLVWGLLVLRSLLKLIPSESYRMLFRYIVVLALLVAGILAAEVIEASQFHHGIRRSIMTCFEESFELLLITGFYQFLLYLQTLLDRKANE